MKPTIFHLINSHGMGWTGGISATLKSLMESGLADSFTFEGMNLDHFLANPPHQKPTAIALHAPSSWKGLKTLWQLKRIAPVLLTEHHYSANFETFNVSSKLRFRTMLRLSYGLSDRVIAVSEAQRQWMIKNRLVDESKIALIQASRIVDNFLAVPPKPRHLDQPFVLGAYGRLCPQKGFDVLIAAMQGLTDPSIQLVIGGTGTDETPLKQQAASCSTVEFVGRIDDVPSFLSRCDAVVIPSRWEPWGNVCLEARATATPVIISTVDGLSEQVQACGLLVPPENPVALAKAIQDLAHRSPEALANLGQQGRCSAESAWDRYLSQWQALLEAVA
ncbi:MAG: glycosyltransferase family 4 protein [Acaryochloris sp. RU_4_1]|nr:glycosyltransferase family 4 protein [Acaryochloris sp. RU_4_1]NJR53455.1 glycosyltransferase family 4 protein [Acaryochloris sp. CRU_2_0]